MESYVKVCTGKFKMHNNQNIFYIKFTWNVGKPTFAGTKKANIFFYNKQ